jgi:hypothetical protein
MGNAKFDMDQQKEFRIPYFAGIELKAERDENR